MSAGSLVGLPRAHLNVSPEEPPLSRSEMSEEDGRGWHVRRATFEDQPAIRELMRRAFGSREAGSASARWDWLFVKSPLNETVRYLVADAGERLAGQYATVPMPMQHNGERTVGLLMVDMATDPGYRRQGVFKALAWRIYRESAAEAPIVFGFPNTVAAPIHYGQFGWVELRPFPLLVRPLGNFRRGLASRPGLVPVAAALDLLLSPVRAADPALARLLEARSISVKPLERFASWADDLWRGLSPRLGTCVVRDAAYLNWRFCQGPYPYRRYALHRHGEPIGFAVSALETTARGKLCHLMELMAPTDDRTGALALLAHAFVDAAREGASTVCAIATRRHPHRRTMLCSGLLPAPSPLKHQMSFGVRHNGEGAVANELFHIDDWYLSGADRDTM